MLEYETGEKKESKIKKPQKKFTKLQTPRIF